MSEGVSERGREGVAELQGKLSAAEAKLKGAVQGE